jgi:hypothetical protein
MDGPAQDNTMYFMHGIPQAIHTNPALRYRCKAYIELPVLSSVQFAFATTGVGYHDAIHYGTGNRADSLVIDVDNVAKKLKRRNYFRTDLGLNILGAGFAVKDFYFHFNVSDQLESRVGYPGDLVRIKDGNWNSATHETKDINLGGLGATAFNYLQIAVGASYKPYKAIRVGLTAKYLMGSASLVNRRSDLDIITKQDPVKITGAVDYRINTSFPVDFSYDTITGYVNNVNFSRADDNIVRDFLLNNNRGAAIDAGVLWDYTDRLTLSASIVNLGFIRWRSNVNRFEADGTFTFQGFDLKEYTNGGGETDFMNALLDSIKGSFQFEGTVRPYTTLLTTKLYLGGYYKLNEYLNVGLLAKTEVFDSRPHFSFTASANANPVSFLHATLSYSIMNNKFYQLGAGLGIGGRIAQFYIITDHIPLRFVSFKDIPPYFFPYNARTLNIRFGVNMVFGCSIREKKDKMNKPKRNRNLCPAYW